MDKYVKKADITSARLLIESEKLAQTADEFPKQMKACAEALGRHTEHYSECRNCRI